MSRTCRTRAPETRRPTNARRTTALALWLVQAALTGCTMHTSGPASGDGVAVGGYGADGGYYAVLPLKLDGGAAFAADAMTRPDARPDQSVDASSRDAQPFSGFDAAESPPYPGDAATSSSDGAASATSRDGGVKGGGDSTVCVQQLAWWLTSATIDTNVVSSTVAAALGPLLTAQHALTLADFGDGGAPTSLVVSGTETNGVSQQYYPYQYPASPAALVISSDSPPVLTATSPAGQPSSGWMRLVDSTQAEVWIALSNISMSATAGDPLCQSLTNGRLSAVIPSSAGATSLSVGGTPSTVAQIFGAANATSPNGWNISIAFTAAKTQVTLK